MNIDASYNLLEAVVNGFAGGIGFTIAIVLMAGIRERLSNKDVPQPLHGFPITLISASLMALAFMGFNGLIK
jgi:electron transport complex protein RnfA